jgi:hypothetical protein
MHFRSQIELHLRLHTSPLNLTFRSYFCSIADLSKSTFRFSLKPHALLRSIRSSGPFCSYTPHQLASLSFPLRLYATSVSGPPKASFYTSLSFSGFTFALHYTSLSFEPNFHRLLLHVHPLSNLTLPQLLRHL